MASKWFVISRKVNFNNYFRTTLTSFWCHMMTFCFIWVYNLKCILIYIKKEIKWNLIRINDIKKYKLNLLTCSVIINFLEYWRIKFGNQNNSVVVNVLYSQKLFCEISLYIDNLLLRHINRLVFNIEVYKLQARSR